MDRVGDRAGSGSPSRAVCFKGRTRPYRGQGHGANRNPPGFLTRPGRATIALQEEIWPSRLLLWSVGLCRVVSCSVGYSTSTHYPDYGPRTMSTSPTITLDQSLRARSQATGLTPNETKRYSRHLIMPEVGVEGQK